MMHTEESLAQALIGRQLLAPGAPSLVGPGHSRPWFISTVLGLAGWLAGIFFMGFVALLFEPKEAGAIALLGGVLVAAAFGLYAAESESAFFDQLALALSIAGQLALIWAAAEITDSATGTAVLTTLMQLAALVVMPNRFAKTLAAFFACVAWTLTVSFACFGESFWGKKAAAPPGPALLSWLVTWVPLLAITQVLVITEVRWVAKGLHNRARPALIGVIASLSIAAWASEPLMNLPTRNAAAEHWNWLALWPLLALLTALFAAYCAFRVRNHALIGLAVFGALLHVSQFYYLLGTTLLIKSCLMLLVGAVLLIAAHQLRTGGVK